MNRLNTNKALHYALLCVVLLLSSCVNTLELAMPLGIIKEHIKIETMTLIATAKTT